VAAIKVVLGKVSMDGHRDGRIVTMKS